MAYPEVRLTNDNHAHLQTYLYLFLDLLADLRHVGLDHHGEKTHNVGT